MIEAGFASLRYTVIAPDASAEQIIEMHLAFFAGAQHLFASLMSVLEPGAEATDRDVNRVQLIADELDHFVSGFKAAHGIESGPGRGGNSTGGARRLN